jgi:16S rRNA (cytidine1402-2'-O)-methyltransferase
MLSPFSSKRFCFEGFPPTKAGERKAFFERLVNEERTSIVYEAPHKLIKTLETARKVLGDDRRVSLVKEITKIHETVFVDTLKTVSKYFEMNEPKGEYVLVIEGVSGKIIKNDIPHAEDIEKTVKDNYEELIKNGFTRKDAMRKIAVDNHLSRNEVYSLLLRVLG